MFAGDTESIFSVDTTSPTAPLPTPLPCQTGLRRSKSTAHAPPYAASVDNIEARLRQVDLREEMFGWSGSLGGIRGRDDHQIERDVEFERKMEERRRRRHDRKLARKQQHQLPTYSPKPTFSSMPVPSPRRRVTLASSLPSDINSLHSPIVPTTAPPLSRGKSLRDRVGAAFNRLQTNSRAPPTRPLQRTRSLSVEAPVASPVATSPPNAGGLNRSLTGMVRKISRRIASDDRRAHGSDIYAAPPTLSHTLVGPASPFPMRPPLSALVDSVPSYGEAHNPYSLDPVRRGPVHHRSRAGPIHAQ